MRRSTPISRSAPAEPCFECLEPRLVLAAVSWDGGAGTLNWHDAANWSTDAVPGIDDDVTIDASGSPTIEFGANAGSRAVRSLLTRNNINLWGGELTVSTTVSVQNSAVVRLTGVTINGGTWAAAPGMGTIEVASNGSVLLGATFTSELRFNVSGSSATLGGGTTFQVARLVGSNSSIRFSPGQTVTGTILFDGSASSDRSVKMAGSGTLTIGPTGRIAATSQFGGTGRVGVPSDPGGTMTLVNHGTIASEPGGLIHVQPEQLTSTGTLRASPYGRLIIEATGSWTTSGTIVADGVYSTILLKGTWSNTGAISVNEARLDLGGTFTTAGLNLSQFSSAGGRVHITGTLDNSNSTLTLDAATGSWEMSGGTIIGGSVEITGAERLMVAQDREGFFNGVSISGDFAVAFRGRATFDGGASFVTARLIGDESSIGFAPGQVLTGTVLFDGVGGTRSVDVRGAAGTLTIGPTGQVLSAPGFAGTGYIGRTGTYARTMTLVNEGLIAAANSGTVSIVAESLTTTGTLRASAGTLRVAPIAAWSNTGTVAVEGGTVDLAGTFTTEGGIGTWSRSGGAVDVTGTLDNTGATTTLDASTGSWKISGTVAGGVVNMADGQVLTTGTIAVLNGVTVHGELLLSGSAPGVTITGGATFTTARLAGSSARIRFAPGQNLTGTILFEGAATGSRYVEIAGVTPGTLTIGPTGRIVVAPGFAGTGSIGGTGPAMTLVNEGYIGSEVSGRTVRIEPQTFTNTLAGSVVAWAGGIVEVAGTFTNAGLLSSRVTGVLAIVGTLNNEGSTQTLSAATGQWHLKGGTIIGGVIDCTDGQPLIMTSLAGTLSGVAVNGELLLLDTSARVTIDGGATFSLARLGGSGSSMSFAPGQTVTGTIQFEGTATGTRTLYMNGSAGILTVGPTGQIRAAADFAGSAAIGGLGAEMTLLNEGLISSEASGRTLTVQARFLTNTGTLRALGGATLAISSHTWTTSGSLIAEASTLTLTGSWSSTGTISVPGSTVNLGGTFSTPGLNAPQFSGAGAMVNVTGTLDNAGSTLSLDGATGAWALMVGTISGGAIELSGGQVLAVAGSSGTLSGVDVGGDILLDSNARVFIGAGTTFQRARLAAGGARLTLTPGHVLTGTILFEGGAGTRSVDMSPSGTLTIGVTGRVLTAPGFGGSATLGALGMTIYNLGLIGSESAGRTVTVRASLLGNVGTLRAVGGGVLSVNANITTNFTAGVLSGGEWFVGTGSTMTTTFGDILTNSAAITLEGSAVWARAATITTNSGTLRLLGARDHAVVGSFTNSGTLTLSPGSLLTAGGFTQTASGRLVVQVSGHDPVTQAGRVVASSAASLDGRLDINAVDGYVPAHPVTFQFISASSVTGAFAQSTVPDVAPNLRASIIYDSTGVRWRVTSIADIDGDGTVSSADISAFLSTWLDSLSGGTLTGDFDGDGAVTSSDISAFLTAWLDAL